MAKSKGFGDFRQPVHAENTNSDLSNYISALSHHVVIARSNIWCSSCWRGMLLVYSSMVRPYLIVQSRFTMGSPTSCRHGEQSFKNQTDEVDSHLIKDRTTSERVRFSCTCISEQSLTKMFPTCSLHALSVRLVDTPTLVQAPPSAAARITPHPLASEVKAQWNHEIAVLFKGFQNLDRSAMEWGRSLLYGPSEGTKVSPPSSTSSSPS